MTIPISDNNKPSDKRAEIVEDLGHHKEQIAEVMRHNPDLKKKTVEMAETVAIANILKI